MNVSNTVLAIIITNKMRKISKKLKLFIFNTTDLGNKYKYEKNPIENQIEPINNLRVKYTTVPLEVNLSRTTVALLISHSVIIIIKYMIKLIIIRNNSNFHTSLILLNIVEINGFILLIKKGDNSESGSSYSNIDDDM